MRKFIPFIAFLLWASTIILAQQVSTFTGGTPDDAIALDTEGNIYCSNYVGNAVFKFTPSGQVSSFVTGLDTPNGIAFNSEGDLYVCDGQGNKVYVFDKDGNEKASYDNPGHPSGIIKSHDSETMIFTEYVGRSINTIAPDGTITEITSDPLLVGPVGLAYDDDNQLYVGNYTNRKIYKVASDGSLTYVATVGITSNLGFIAYANGSLWGTVLAEHKIYKINPNAVDDVEVFAGTTGGLQDGLLSEAKFNQPNGITFNSAGDTMFITDFGTKNLRIIDLENVTSTSNLNEREDQFVVYPNPIADEFKVQLKGETHFPYDVEVYDSAGQSIYTTVLGSSEHIINSSSWIKGNYFIKVSSKGLTQTKKIIKK